MEEGVLFTPVPWHDDEDEVEEEEEEGDEGITKRLVFETPMKTRASKKQSVVVYLRVRPKTQREIMSMDAACLHLISERELQTMAPISSQTFKNKAGVRCPAESSQVFTFTHIFDAQSSQLEVFEESMLPTLKHFFQGQNCLVFTYGVTNSGKTYTVTGTATEPGILPRSLDLIFNSVSPHQLSSLQLRPRYFSEAVYLTEEETEKEQAKKDEILSRARELSISEGSGAEDTAELTTYSNVSSPSKTMSEYSKVSDTGTSLDDVQIQDGSTIDLEDSSNVCYSLWVSFAEIYNEFIYDLLGEEPKARRRRPALKLAEDKNYNHFIKGLVEVRVSSTEEAMLLLKLGLRHRHVASTCLNYQSSRSHTIFTIKLIKMDKNSERPTKALVNRISIVDLAGAERSMKTGATGMRVKEAGNINNSLLTLGKCIEAMRHNQNKRRGDEHVVPFRESKLTRLFQNYFVGKGKGIRQGRITMLVNVSDNASVFDETAHVLKFSAITSKVIPVVKPVAARSASQPRPPASSQRPAVCTATGASLVTPRPGRTTGRDDDRTIEAKRTVSATVCGQCEMVKDECAQLRKRICDLEVEKMESEYTIRQDVCREFQEQLTEIEVAHREELVEQAEDMQEMYEKRMKLLQKSMKKQFSRKRRRVETEEEGEGEGGVERKEGAVEVHMREKVSELEEQLQEERERVAAVSAELKDALETHESRVIRLNHQVNSVSLQLAKAERRERELQDKLSAVRAAEEAAEAGANREAELVVSCENLQRQLDMANSKVLEMAGESEHERLSLISEYEGRERRLRDEIGALKAELQSASEATSDLTARLEQIQRDMATAAGEHAESVQRAVAGREDAVVEVEILHARISELTWEAKHAELDPTSSSDSSTQTPPSTSETLGSLSEEIVSVREELKASRQRECELKSSSEQCRGLLEQQLADVKMAHSALQQQLSQAREQEKALQHQCKEMEEELQTLATSSSEDKTAAHLHSAEVQSLRETVKTLHEAREKTEIEHRVELETVEQQLNQAREQKEALKQQLKEREEELQALVTSSSEDKTAAHLLSAEVQSLKETVETLHEAHEKTETEHRSQLEAVQQELSQAKERDEALQHQLKGKEEELQALVTSSSEDKTAAHSLSAEVQSLRETVKTLHEEREKTETEHKEQVETVHEAVQQQLNQAKEQEEALKQQLKEREEELQALVTSSSEDKTAAHSLSAEVQSLRETVETLHETHEKTETEHRAQLAAAKDNHQGEREKHVTAIRDLEKKVADLEQQLENIVTSQESERAGEVPAEDTHIYDQPPEHSTFMDEPTVYENEGESQLATDAMSTSVHLARSDSKPFVAVLERSSQLVEDTFTEEPRVIIDATPPIAKRGRRGKKVKKRSIEEVAQEEDSVTPDVKKGKYQLRNRRKHQRFVEDDENRTPIHKPTLKNILTRSTKKIAALATRPPSPQLANSTPAPAPVQKTTRRTARRAKPLRKSQISGPLGLLEDDAKIPRNRGQAMIGPGAPPLYLDN